MAATLLNRPRAEQVLAGAGVDVLVATTFANVHYVSGFLPFSQRFLPTTQVYAVAAADRLEEAAVIAPIGEADMYAQLPPVGARMAYYGRFVVEPAAEGGSLDPEMERFARAARSEARPGALQALVAELDRFPATARIAVDQRGIDPAGYAALRERYGERISPGAELLDRIRMVKTPEEVRRLTRAVEAIEAAYEAALAAAAAGMTEAEMAAVFDRETIAQGCVPLFTVIAFGERSALPNAVPGGRRLHNGDIIRFDIGCRSEAYASDIARTAVFGQPTARQRAYYQAILDGEDAALAVLRPGVRAADVFAAAVAGTRRGGIPRYDRHHVGHGIGLDVYDHPVLAPGAETALEPGMVLEVETPYYEVGFGGLQVEDTALVTDRGFRLLTRTPRELRIVGG
jgi:Xaa-Pro dipeptidase